MEIRKPNIGGNTEKEQMEAIRAYLFYLANELSFAFSEGEAKETKTIAMPTQAEVQTLFHAMKGLIAKSDSVYQGFLARYEKEEGTWNALAPAEEEASAFFRYRKERHHIYMEFCHSYTEMPLSKEKLPEELCPETSIHALCPTEKGFCRAILETDGTLTLAGGSAEDGTVYGSIHYFK